MSNQLQQMGQSQASFKSSLPRFSAGHRSTFAPTAAVPTAFVPDFGAGPCGCTHMRFGGHSVPKMQLKKYVARNTYIRGYVNTHVRYVTWYTFNYSR